MTHTFKIRYANVLVGSLVLLVLALLLVSTIFIGAKKQWFKNPFTLEAELPYRRSLGLKVGTSVFLMDSVAGEVESLHYHHNGYITATLRFKEVFKAFIRTNAVGLMRKEFGVVGEQRIMLSQQEEGPTFDDLPQTVPLKIQPDVDVVAGLLKTADRISAEVPKLVEDARATIGNVRTLTQQLSDPQKGVQPLIVELTSAIKRVRLLLETVQTGPGFIAKALNDPAFAKSLQDVTDGISQTLAKIRSTLDRVQTLSGQMEPVLTSAKGTLDSVRTVAGDLHPVLTNANEVVIRLPAIVDHADAAVSQAPALLLQLQTAAEELQTLLQGLQHNWLLKGGVDEAKREQLETVSTNAVLFHP